MYTETRVVQLNGASAECSLTYEEAGESIIVTAVSGNHVGLSWVPIQIPWHQTPEEFAETCKSLGLDSQAIQNMTAQSETEVSNG